MAELQPIIVCNSRHFVRNRGICNLICVNLLQLMPGVITHYLVKTKRSLHINKCLSYGQLQYFTAAIFSAILEFEIGFVYNSYKLCSVSFRAIQKKNEVSVSNRFLEVHKRVTHTHIRTHARTHAHTHTHDDSIRRNAVRCISPKNHNKWRSDVKY